MSLKRSSKKNIDTKAVLIMSPNLPFLSIPEGITIISMIITMAEFVYHAGDQDPTGINFAYQNLFGFILLSSIFITRGLRLTRPDYIKGFFPTIRFVGLILGCFFTILGIQIFFNSLLRPQRFAITAVEYYFLYINFAIAEENLYRLTIISVTKKIGSLFTNNVIILNIIAAIISAFAFMISHVVTYGSDPFMFAATFFAGLTFAIFYIAGKDNVLVTQPVHAINNLIAAYNIITLLGI